MQFFSTLALLSLAAAAVATPAPVADTGATIEKRTCGTLTGTALTICQDACIAACSVASLGIASTLCKNACKAGPL